MNRSSTAIRRTLMRMIFLAGGVVLLVTSSAFCAYEFLTFRQSSIQQLQILSRAIASNSTAALAFENADDAASVLTAFKSDPHIVAAALYDVRGKVFATYPQELAPDKLPSQPGKGFTFGRSALIGYQPVAEGSKQLGVLYVESDQNAMYSRIELYGMILLLVAGISLSLAYLISRRLQHRLLQPILALADTARAVAERHDYTVRAAPTGAYEFDLFTDTFNHMLTQIQAVGGKAALSIEPLEPAAAHHACHGRAAGPTQHFPSGAGKPGRESAHRLWLLPVARRDGEVALRQRLGVKGPHLRGQAGIGTERGRADRRERLVALRRRSNWFTSRTWFKCRSHFRKDWRRGAAFRGVCSAHRREPGIRRAGVCPPRRRGLQQRRMRVSQAAERTCRVGKPPGAALRCFAAGL